MRPLSLIASLLAAPLFLLAAQDPPDQDPPVPDEELPSEVETWEELRERLKRETMELLEGCWSLQEFHSINEVVPRKDVAGYLMIVDGYLSIIIHARTPVPQQIDLFEYSSQANISQFELTLDGSTSMLAASLIGHSDFSGEFGYEVPNIPRQFQVEVLEHDLYLRRVDGATLRFRRMIPGSFTPAARRNLEEERGGGGF